ncbi:MAG: hypothetical protein U0K68_04795 [Agathobacter sp.]|nr:hypothetical protein [Agathobacter sp.]
MKKSTLLLVPAVGLLVFSAIESASAALSYVSNDYNMSLETASLNIELTENGTIIENGNKLLTNLVGEGEEFHIGQKYSEELAVTNTGDYDSYVRLILTKSWLNEDGSKNTALAPELISLGINTGEGWNIDEASTTSEQIVLYYSKPLPAGSTTPNAVDSVTILNDVTTAVTKHGTTGNITTTYDYTGKSFSLEAEVDGIQTHNAQDAIYSAWGIPTAVSDNGNISLADEYTESEPNVITNNKDWKVDFDGDKVNSNFDSDEVADAVTDAMPGDVLTFRMDIENTSDDKSNWYMTNEVVKSLEDDSNANGGAYSYKLSYVSPEGKQEVLYSSDAVGGDNDSIKGLHQATNSTDKYFYLDNLNKGEKGTVELSIQLDGKTQNNTYQSTLAEMDMRFAVEKGSENEKTNEEPDETPDDDSDRKPDKPDKVKTGDNNSLIISFISLVAGFILVGIWYSMNKSSRQKKGDA